MEFRRLAIKKRSSQVWTLLRTVKTELATFGAILEKTQKNLQEASSTIDKAAVRSRAIERKLRDVQDHVSHESAQLAEDADDEAEMP